VKEARLRQRSLLDVPDSEPLPPEIRAKAFELLVELFIAAIPALEGGKRDEQDQE
jgi:hypothetical protein